MEHGLRLAVRIEGECGALLVLATSNSRSVQYTLDIYQLSERPGTVCIAAEAVKDRFDSRGRIKLEYGANVVSAAADCRSVQDAVHIE